MFIKKLHGLTIKNHKTMLNNILSDIQRILRGKNGNVFLIIGAVILVLFFLRIMGPLMWLLIVGGIIYFVFRFLEGKK
jgi:uncharacterized membrane protein YecN with MAPEG domain